MLTILLCLCFLFVGICAGMICAIGSIIDGIVGIFRSFFNIFKDI